MKKSVCVLFCGIAFMITSMGVATAGLLDTLGLGSKATSMGGAFAAYADDPFAIYYNPAGLSQIEKFTVSNGLHLALPWIEVKNFHVDGGHYKKNIFAAEIPISNEGINGYYDISNKKRVVPAPHFATAYPVNENIVAGFAIYAPFGAEVYWPDDVSENPGAYNTTFGSIKRIAATPTISYKFNDYLSFGLGLSIGVTEVKAEKIFYLPEEVMNELNANYNAMMNSGSYNMAKKIAAARDAGGRKVVAEMLDPFNFSFNLGLMYRFSDKVNFGLTYRSRADVNVDGTVELEGLNESYGTLNNGEPIKTKVDAETEMDHPPQIQFGVRYQPSEDFTIELDYVWTKWSIIDGYTIQFSPKLVASRESEDFRRYWLDTNQVRLGAEWITNEFVTIRAGYYYDPSPVPEETFDFSTSDVNKRVYSVGIGLNYDWFTVDTVFQYISSTDYETNMTEVDNEPLSASFEFKYDKDLNAEVIDQAAAYEASMTVWALGTTFNFTF